MGVWFFATAIAEFLAGQLAALTDKIARGELFHLFGGQADFFLVLVVFPIAVAVPLFALTPWLRPAHARAGRVRLRRGSRAACYCRRPWPPPSRPPSPPARTTSSITCTASTSPIPIAGSRTPTRPRCSAGPTRRTPRPARALDRVPGRAALEQRLWQLYEIGSVGVPVSRAASGKTAPLLLHAPRRQAEPARALRARRRWTAPIARWSTSTASAPTARARSTGGFPPTTARWSPTASPTTAARSRCCACATWRPARTAPTRSRARAPARWPGRPTARGFYYTRYPAPGEVPADELKYHRAVYHHRLGDDPAKDRKLFGDGRDKTDWPGVDLSPDGRWLAITVSQGWSKSEVYLADIRAGGAPVAVAAGEDAEVQRRRGARRSPASVHDQRRAARPALRRRSGAARARALARDRSRSRPTSCRASSTSAAGSRSRRCRTRRCACGCYDRRRGAARRHRAARAGRADGADRRARHRRDLLRVHVVPRARPRCFAST